MSVAEATSRAAYRLPAKLGDMRVVLIDYNADGVLLEHYRPVRTDQLPVFLLEWDGERVSQPCRVAVSEQFPVRFGSSIQVYRSTLLFVNPERETIAMIDRIIRERARISISLQMANASGRTADPYNEPTFRDGLIGASGKEEEPEFLRMCWDGCAWASVCTADPEQPPDGFTIDAAEPASQIHTLCDLYEMATSEGRVLIREQARISLEGKAARKRARFWTRESA
ncbi:MAG TPA: hypothetical protein VGF40_03970 [Thermoanaerobaculia bacterium]